jgi:hypothetical protein
MKNIGWTLGVVLLVGLMLRLAGLTYGLPLNVLGDEFVHVYTAFTFIDDMTLRALTPLSYVPSLFAILTIPFIAVFGLLGMVFGVFEGVVGFKEYAILNATNFVLIGRALSILFGVALVYLVYKLARPLSNEWAALTVAALAALDFWMVHESSKGHFWIPVTALLAWAFLMLLKMSETGRLRHYVAAASSIALGVWMGFFPVVLAPFFVLAHWHTRVKRLSYLVWGVGGLTAAFLLIAWLNPLSIMRQFGRALRSALNAIGIEALPQFVGPSDNPTEPLQNLYFLMHTLFLDNPFVFVLGVGGLILLAYRLTWRSFPAQLFIGFFVLYIGVAMFVWPHPDHRYVLPLLVPLLVGTAYLLSVGYEWMCAWSSARTIRAVVVALTVGYSLYVTTSYATLLLQPDTRILALRWIEANVPRGAGVYTHAQYFELPKSREAIEVFANVRPEALRERDRVAATLPDERFPQPSYFVIDSQYAGPLGTATRDFRYDYVVTGFKMPEERIEVPTGFELVASFYPRGQDEAIDDLLLTPKNIFTAVGAVSNLGPHIEIYKRVE